MVVTQRPREIAIRIFHTSLKPESAIFHAFTAISTRNKSSDHTRKNKQHLHRLASSPSHNIYVNSANNNRRTETEDHNNKRRNGGRFTAHFQEEDTRKKHCVCSTPDTYITPYTRTHTGFPISVSGRLLLRDASNFSCI